MSNRPQRRDEADRELLPQATNDSIKRKVIGLKGPNTVTDRTAASHRERWMRQELELYVHPASGQDNSRAVQSNVLTTLTGDRARETWKTLRPSSSTREPEAWPR